MERRWRTKLLARKVLMMRRLQRNTVLLLSNLISICKIHHFNLPTSVFSFHFFALQKNRIQKSRKGHELGLNWCPHRYFRRIVIKSLTQSNLKLLKSIIWSWTTSCFYSLHEGILCACVRLHCKLKGLSDRYGWGQYDPYEFKLWN